MAFAFITKPTEPFLSDNISRQDVLLFAIALSPHGQGLGGVSWESKWLIDYELCRLPLPNFSQVSSHVLRSGISRFETLNL